MSNEVKGEKMKAQSVHITEITENQAVDYLNTTFNQKY
jgi:hypothetical protein